LLISIQQPEFFPWLGFFDKIKQVDKVVFLDNVQFKKRYFENRNKIRTKTGWSWIRVPVIAKGRYTQLINEVEIDNSQKWQQKLVNSIKCNYSNKPHWFSSGGEELCELISKKEYTRLVEFNLEIISFISSKFKSESEYKMILASSLGTENKGSDLIHEICMKVGAKKYLSGRDGKDYLDEKKFKESSIQVLYQDFKHPVYEQHSSEGFLDTMSAIDLLFNYGCDGLEILNKPKYL
jgi:WbqC-like protein